MEFCSWDRKKKGNCHKSAITSKFPAQISLLSSTLLYPSLPVDGSTRHLTGTTESPHHTSLSGHLFQDWHLHSPCCLNWRSPVVMVMLPSLSPEVNQSPRPRRLLGFMYLSLCPLPLSYSTPPSSLGQVPENLMSLCCLNRKQLQHNVLKIRASLWLALQCLSEAHLADPETLHPFLSLHTFCCPVPF